MTEPDRDIRLVVLGGSGHAAVVVEACLAQGAEVVGVTTETGIGPSVLDKPVLGRDGDLAALRVRHGLTHFIVGIGSIRGGSALRERVFQIGLANGLAAFSTIHPRAIVGCSATVGQGVLVCAGAVVQARARIGDNAIINTAAVVDHDCDIGSHAHIAPGAVLSGNVQVGRLALIGVGAVVRQSVRIGVGATIGAGAVVVDDCPDHAVLTGVPARPVAPK